MNKTPHMHRAFSLVEMLIATSISVLILTVTTSAMISAWRVWSAASAGMDLSIQSRMVRERVLHGIQGQFGLRQAARASVACTSTNLQFRDARTGDWFLTLLRTNSSVSIQNADASRVYSMHDDTRLRAATTHRSNNILTVDLTLDHNAGRFTVTQSQRIKVYLLND